MKEILFQYLHTQVPSILLSVSVEILTDDMDHTRNHPTALIVLLVTESVEPHGRTVFTT